MPRPIEPTRDRARAGEAGFSLLEMIIAGFIIVILMIVALKAFTGAKKATYFNEGKSVGSAYMQAVSQYQGDFANRNPTLTGNNTAAVKKGPLNLTGQPYLKSVPDSVTANRTGVSMGTTNCGALGTPSGASTHTSWVSVCYGAEPAFAVRVVARKTPGAAWTAAAGASICWMGATTATPKC